MQERWVLIHYFPHEPTHVYGTFDSETEAWEYGQRQGFAVAGGAYEAQMIRDINEE
jgi:hypothetical protein